MTTNFDPKYLKNKIDEETDSSRIMANIKKYSFAKTNRYFIVFTLPPAVQTYIEGRDSIFKNPADRLNNISFNCTFVATPQRAFNLVDTINSGHECVIPTNQTLTTLSIAFNCFADMKEKVLFEYWMDYIYNNNKRKINFFNDYVTDEFKIIQMDAKNNPMYGTILKKVFPQVIQSVSLDHQPSSIPVRVDITLAYMYLEYFDYNQTSNTTPPNQSSIISTEGDL